MTWSPTPTANDDTITWTGALPSDSVDGGAGNDSIVGTTGQDTLLGGEDGDSLVGGADNDSLDGGPGRDRIIGGTGDDILLGNGGDTGGDGAIDRFVFTGSDIGVDDIWDFAPGEDVIDLSGLLGVSPEKILVTDNPQGEAEITIKDIEGKIILHGVQASQLVVNADETVTCYLAGTLIATPDGERRVEDLSIGDCVTTLGGIAMPVKWIGRRSYRARFLRRDSEAWPVRIRAGALGPGRPHTDLFVSGRHAVVVGDVMVQAQDLVDGDWITRDGRGLRSVAYYHVELDTPAILIANGAPAESFVDQDSRQLFANAAEYTDLYGESPAAGPLERPLPLLETAEDLGFVRQVLDRLRSWRRRIARAA